MDIEEAKRRASAGPRLLLARRVALLAITFISTVTVARLVAPREYGLAAMSAITLSFIQVFRDFGLTNAVLRKGTIDQSELTMIFWFNVATTTGLSLVLALLAPAISAFYDEPVVLWTTLASIIGFQIGGVALQHRALINRDMRFSAIAVIDIAAQLGGFAVTLTLALLRHDVWALVIGGIAHSVIGSGIAIWISGWRPGRPALAEGFRDLLKFGANSSVFSISVLLSNNVAQMLVGYSLGSAMLGQYNRAQILYQLPNVNLIHPISQSVMPLLTRLRVDPAEYRAAYLALVRRLCVFLMPLAMTLMATAVPLTRALLGDAWDTAGWVLMALAPSLAVAGVGHTVGHVFVTQNRSAELRNLGLLELGLRVSAIATGVYFGIVETAIGFTFSTIAVVLIRVWVAGREGTLTVWDHLVAAWPGIPPALGALAAAALCRYSTLSLADWTQAVAAGLAGMGGAFITACVVQPSRAAMMEFFEMFGLNRISIKQRIG